jgi:hypothetical protein
MCEALVENTKMALCGASTRDGKSCRNQVHADGTLCHLHRELSVSDSAADAGSRPTPGTGDDTSSRGSTPPFVDPLWAWMNTYLRGPTQRARIVWAPGLVIVLGVVTAHRYADSADLSSFFSTSAQVIATLYIAIVINLVTPERDSASASRATSTEHWMFFLLSTMGMLGSLAGLVHSTGVALGMTVTGISAAILLVVDALIVRMLAGRFAAAVWATLFIVTTAAIITVLT